MVMFKGKQRSPVEVIVFSILTCGIYYLYWIYKFSEEMKFYLEDNSASPGVDLLLSIFCFPYQYYWFYKQAKNIAAAQTKVGLAPEDNAVLYLVLAIFSLGIVNIAIMQSSVNKVWAQQ